MAFKPRHELPVTGPDGGDWPNVMQLPIQLRKIIDASQNWFDNTEDQTQVADQIVDLYSASIANFVDVNRRNVASGITNVQSRFQNFPGLTLQYENRHGAERLSMTVYPESLNQNSGSPGLELNYDGYIYWAHGDPGFPDAVNGQPFAPTPYDIFLNGYTIYSGYDITQIAQGFVIMFGPTALRCHSVADDKNPFKGANFGTNKIWGPNGGLYYVNVPTWQPDDPTVSAPDGLTVPSHKAEPIYPLFDWDNTNNTGNLLGEPFENGQRWADYPMPDPTTMKGVQFADAQKSPLVWNGVNNLTIMIRGGSQPGATENNIFESVVAEFYDRAKLISGSETWSHIVNAATSSYAMNNKPMFFAALHGGAFVNGINLTIDLTKNSQHLNDAFIPDATWSPVTNELALVGLSQAQQNALTAYTAEVAAIITAFNAAQAPAIAAALLAFSKDEVVLTNIETYLSAYTEGLFSSTDFSQSFFTFESFFPVGQPPTTGNATIDSYISESSSEPGLWVVTTSQGNFWSVLQTGLAAETATAAADLATYTALVSAQPPLPPVPSTVGTPLDSFVWRTVAVNDSTWSFGDWQNLGS